MRGTNAWAASYTFEDGIDAPRTMDRADIADVDGDSNTTEVMRFAYHQQAIGSVTELSDSNGAIVEWTTYDVYGVPTIRSSAGNTVSLSAVGNPLQFASREWDLEVEAYLCRARSYDPKSGRFLQRDPMGCVDGPSRYEYSRSNPATNVDPLGLAARRIVVPYRATHKEGDVVKTPAGEVSLTAFGAGQLNVAAAVANWIRNNPKDESGAGALRAAADSIGRAHPCGGGLATESATSPYVSVSRKRIMDDEGRLIGWELSIPPVTVIVMVVVAPPVIVAPPGQETSPLPGKGGTPPESPVPHPGQVAHEKGHADDIETIPSGLPPVEVRKKPGETDGKFEERVKEAEQKLLEDFDKKSADLEGSYHDQYGPDGHPTEKKPRKR